MQTIELTKGRKTIVDDEDYSLLSKWRWCVIDGKGQYAGRVDTTRGGRELISMHRLLAGIHGDKSGLQVDHINGDTLDNRKSNLRVCTQHQNSLNRKVRLDSTLNQKDISIRKNTVGGKTYVYYRVRVQLNGKRHSSNYKTLDEAIKARDEMVRTYHGDYSRLS